MYASTCFFLEEEADGSDPPFIEPRVMRNKGMEKPVVENERGGQWKKNSIRQDLEESMGTACVPIQAGNRKFQPQELPHHQAIHFLLSDVMVPSM